MTHADDLAPRRRREARHRALWTWLTTLTVLLAMGFLLGVVELPPDAMPATKLGALGLAFSIAGAIALLLTLAVVALSREARERSAAAAGAGDPASADGGAAMGSAALDRIGREAARTRTLALHAPAAFSLTMAVLLIATASPSGSPGAGVGLMVFGTWLAYVPGLGVLLPPKVNARRSGDDLILSVAAWRRGVFVGPFIVPAFVLLWVPAPLLVRAIGSLLMMGCDLLMLWGLGLQLRVSAVGLRIERGFGSGREVSWAGIQRALITQGGTTLWESRGGRPVVLSARMLDGYPECAALMLERLPAAVLDQSPDARDLLGFHASRSPRGPR